MKMKKRLISIAMAAVMAVGSIPAAGALLDGFNNTRTYSNQFTDVPSTAWYYNSVKSAYELGITAGTSASKFSPDQNLTTDQLTVFLARIHAAYHHNEIVEVQNPSSWADKYYYYVEQYVLTFTDHNINVKTYGSDPYRYSYNVNFTSTGAMN